MTDQPNCRLLNQTIVEVTKSAMSEVIPEVSDRTKDSSLEA